MCDAYQIEMKTDKYKQNAVNLLLLFAIEV